MQIWCLAVSMLWCSLFVADLIVGMEELELHYRCRGDLISEKLELQPFLLVRSRLRTLALKTGDFSKKTRSF